MATIASPVSNLDEELSLQTLIDLFHRRRTLILGTALLVSAMAASVALFRPLTYRSSATFAPRAGKAASGAVSGLAAQFGISVPGGDPADSPYFYADLVRTRTIMDSVLQKPYPSSAADQRGRHTIAQVLVPEEGGARQLADARQLLEKRISTDVNQKTNVVTITVNASDAYLAKVIASEMLHAINSFALEGRQSRAHQERIFTQTRAEEARSQLADAENQLESFLESNRSVGAPRLEFEQERMRRVIATRQALYTALAQAADQSRIEELRDTPSLTIVEEPELPLSPQSRGLLTLPLLGAVFGAVLGLLLAIAGDVIRRDRSATAPEVLAEG